MDGREYMKKFLLILSLLILPMASANEEDLLIENNKINTRINNIGTKILNANKIEKRIVFTYDKNTKLNLLKGTETLTKRQVVVYGDAYGDLETDEELAAYLAREIPAALRSYDGIANGWLSSAKIKAAPKKYELVFDKFAVDYLVKAGYNPLALIIYINKTCPQKRQDTISNKNLTSKRLAHIYEYIYMKYPYFLVNNSYLENEYYQNFLLTSQNNRKLLREKVLAKDWKKDLKYE